MTIVKGITAARKFASIDEANRVARERSSSNIRLVAHYEASSWYLRVAGYQTQFLGEG